ncbi:hypothetical protein HMPREF1619_05945 [Klebsiella pneumoniae 909957]|nr:hypothetical protein HMPREF1619_05945 [Klebsiella pneumoniae 909957]
MHEQSLNGIDKNFDLTVINFCYRGLIQCSSIKTFIKTIIIFWRRNATEYFSTKKCTDGIIK